MKNFVCLKCLEKGKGEVIVPAVQKKNHLKNAHADQIKGKEEDVGFLTDLAEQIFVKEEDYIKQKAEEEVGRLKAEIDSSHEAEVKAVKAERDAKLQETLQKVKELSEEKARMEADKKALEAQVAAEKGAAKTRELFEEEQEAGGLLEPDLGFELPPGIWFVNFLKSKGIPLSPDEEYVMKQDYKKRLPDVRILEYMLARTFGVKADKVQRICMVYARMLQEYLIYHKNKEREFKVPRGNITVPGDAEREYGSDWPPVFDSEYEGEDYGPTLSSYPQDRNHLRARERLSEHRVRPEQPASSSPGLETSIEKLASIVTVLDSRLAAMESGRRNPGVDFQESVSEIGEGSHRFGAFQNTPGVRRAPQQPPFSEEAYKSPEVNALETHVAQLSANISALTTNFETLQKVREEELKQQQEEKKRQELLRDIEATVARLIASNVGPVAERLSKLETELPNAFSGLGFEELIKLRRDIRDGLLDERKLNFVMEKYRDEREADTKLKEEIVSGIKGLGDTIGEAMGDAVGKSLKGGAGPTEAPQGTIPTLTGSGNLIKFQCSECQRTVTADRNSPIATCLCGVKYELLANTPLGGGSGTSGLQPPRDDRPLREKGTENILIVQPGGSGKKPPEELAVEKGTEEGSEPLPSGERLAEP